MWFDDDELNKYYDYYKPFAAKINARLKAMKKSGNVDVDLLIKKLKEQGVEFTRRGNVKAKSLDEESVNILLAKVPTSRGDKNYKNYGANMEMDFAIDAMLEFYYEGSAVNLRGTKNRSRHFEGKKGSRIRGKNKIKLQKKISKELKALGGQINEGSIKPDQVYRKIAGWTQELGW